MFILCKHIYDYLSYTSLSVIHIIISLVYKILCFLLTSFYHERQVLIYMILGKLFICKLTLHLKMLGLVLFPCYIRSSSHQRCLVQTLNGIRDTPSVIVMRISATSTSVEIFEINLAKFAREFTLS